ncbi:MAG: hypothetical protein QMD13_06975 [Candidatus Bathyarchaeia archaeon]|nr:hypothetical protein [Candidatus Bathyarchaeia archaeon]
MKKILVYSAVAVVLGLILTLVPLITLTEIQAENHYMAGSLSEQLEKLEGTYGLNAPKYSVAELEIFAISFVIALVVYVVFKRSSS